MQGNQGGRAAGKTQPLTDDPCIRMAVGDPGHVAGQAYLTASHLIWLSDETWAAIAPLLPYGRPGAPRVDDHRIVSGIVFVLVSGCRWQDCPPDYGPATTVYNRFARWSRRNFWPAVLEALADAGIRPAKPTAASGRRRISVRE